MSVKDTPAQHYPGNTVALRWDVFCHVVDNFGDVGICWRLSRQLVAEQKQQVRLWVDDLSALVILLPQADIASTKQIVDGVEICRWLPEWPLEPVADVVVEAFGCTIPPDYLAAMAASARPIVWLNLEYLSAEGWVEDYHGLPSMLSGGLKKYFFFPGFSDKTGGLLREADLIQRRDRFQGSRSAQAEFLRARSVVPAPDAIIISLFSYENPRLGAWLSALGRNNRRVCLLVPQGRILGELQSWLGVDTLVAGDHHRRNALDIHILPFSSQDDYDRLLWCCDFNVVRGEDSFVRAQWAGRPMLWHIYPQKGGGHLPKLDAFLDLYTQSLPPAARAALRRFWLDWNIGAEPGASWGELQDLWPDIEEGAKGWCRRQLDIENISKQIVTFAQEGRIIAAADLA